MARNRILYIDLLLFSFAFFVFFDVYLVHLFFVFVLLLPLVSLLAALPVRRAVRYRMEIEEEIVPKGRCVVDLTAVNRGFLPCACVRMQIQRRNALGRVGERYAEMAEETVQFALGSRRAFTIRPAIRVSHCGRVDILIRRVRVCDMLGLFCLPVPVRNAGCASGSIYVLPELQSRAIQTDDAADLGLDSATYSTAKPGGDPSEIFQLRDYREGDSRHSVHWKLSSRMDRLIVREFGLPLNPSLHFLLELRADAEPAAAEYMLGTALAFSEYLMAREIVHRISWLGEEGLLHTAQVTGADELAAALHELLALPGQKRWSALEHFAMQETPQAETHLVYLIAGALWRPAADAEAEQMLGSLLDLGVCRRMTLMPDHCSRETAEGLRSLGCEVLLLSGHSPGMELEEEL